MEFVGANITKADNRAVLYHDRVEAILGIGAFRFRAPIPKMRPVHICIIDLSVADCLGACRVNKIRVFMNVREILTRSEEHTSELQSLMRISYAVFCLKK